jgi:hypothetical protein
MLQVGFEPTIPASERANKVHPLDRAPSVTGTLSGILGANSGKVCVRTVVTQP